jgi:hypothetical protein
MHSLAVFKQATCLIRTLYVYDLYVKIMSAFVRIVIPPTSAFSGSTVQTHPIPHPKFVPTTPITTGLSLYQVFLYNQAPPLLETTPVREGHELVMRVSWT